MKSKEPIVHCQDSRFAESTIRRILRDLDAPTKDIMYFFDKKGEAVCEEDDLAGIFMVLKPNPLVSKSRQVLSFIAIDTRTMEPLSRNDADYERLPGLEDPPEFHQPRRVEAFVYALSHEIGHWRQWKGLRKVPFPMMVPEMSKGKMTAYIQGGGKIPPEIMRSERDAEAYAEEMLLRWRKMHGR